MFKNVKNYLKLIDKVAQLYSLAGATVIPDIYQILRFFYSFGPMPILWYEVTTN